MPDNAETATVSETARRTLRSATIIQKRAESHLPAPLRPGEWCAKLAWRIGL